ncbi:hypothetical protein [Kitasatospora sp. NPDC057223]|uniref:hypothetical protein n=1 Tax=Kitasatospora sp. NPDC057223 TaxID=3346055 RepID=UPI003629D46C
MDDEYRQRVRRHSPSSLLPLIAAAGARHGRPGEGLDSVLNSPYRKYTPWALADAARVAVAEGTEFNRTDATEGDLLAILAAHSSLKDPTLHGDGIDADRVRDFLLRTAGQQFVYQLSEFGTWARTAALYLHTPFPEHRTPRILATGWEEELLGCSLADYISISNTLWASAVTCGGRFDLSLMDSPGGERVWDVVDRETTMRVLERHFSIDPAEFKRADTAVRERMKGTPGTTSQMRQFTHNPLVARPALTGYGDSWLLCPVPQLVFRKAGPAGISFTGLQHYGTDFNLETGYLFEEYVGRQLRLLRNAEVLPEIHYTVKRQVHHGVDWIVVFDDLVLLVEVKAAMPTERAGLGISYGLEETARKIGKAYQQISRTEELIASGRPEFAAVPTDRPRHGLVVTLEPFHIVNAPLPMPNLTKPPIFTTVASASELEQLVCFTEDSPSKLLLERAADPQRSTWDLNAAFANRECAPNPVLEEAWSILPWTQASRRANRTTGQ